jgi:hypothetical protein
MIVDTSTKPADVTNINKIVRNDTDTNIKELSIAQIESKMEVYAIDVIITNANSRMIPLAP